MSIRDVLQRVLNTTIRNENEYPIIESKMWYSTSYTPRYWFVHYKEHIKASKTRGDLYASGTYDLTLLYLLKDNYNYKDFKKIQRLTSRILIDFLNQYHKKMYLEFELSPYMEIIDFVFENIVLAYLLGICDDKNNEIYNLINEKIFTTVDEVIVNLSLDDDALRIFPYFSLLFSNYFNREIIVSKKNLIQYRDFFSSIQIRKRVNLFVVFCRENKYGVFQYKTGNENLNGSREYQLLIFQISRLEIDFMKVEFSEDMFEVLKPIIEPIKQSFNRK